MHRPVGGVVAAAQATRWTSALEQSTELTILKPSTFENLFLGGSLAPSDWSTEPDIETTSSFKVVFLHRPVGGVVAAAQATRCASAPE